MPNFVPVTYGNGAPVLASNGSQRVAVPALAEWLAMYDALQVFRGRGHVTFYQTMGGADASAGTHLCGSAWDMAYTGTAPIMDAREMGAASWPRLHSNGWVGGEHVHSLIRCGDNSCNGYQMTAYLSGHNGLGLNGVGAGDRLPRPATIRTWQDGIAWARAQMSATTSTTTTTQEDDDMKAFLKAPGSNDVFVSDGVTAWKVADATALANYAQLVREGLLSIKQPAPSSTGAVFFKTNAVDGTGVWVREVPANLIGKVVA